MSDTEVTRDEAAQRYELRVGGQLAGFAEYQTTPEFRKRYANRAGIEATNSELKRGHGLGWLRVRRHPRVKLAVVLKVIACNVKRFLNYVLACAERSTPRSELALS